MIRPSHKELSGKLRTALEAVQSDLIQLVEPVVIAADAIELEYSLTELQAVLLDLLTCAGPEHYTGNRPPTRSYETCIRDLELWAFTVTIPRFEVPVYFKFTIKNGWFYLVSLHADRPGKIKGGAP